jgi:DNA-binding protein Fis
MGTSQGMVSKLTGINQGTISKKIKELKNGLSRLD